MKLLALVTDAYGGGGGIAQYNRDLFAALSALPEVQSIVILPRAGYATTSLWGIQNLPPTSGRIAYAWTAWRWAKTVRPDVIFCGHLFMLPLASLLGYLQRKPVWLQIHGIEAWKQPSRLSRWLASRVSCVSSVSRYSRARFLCWAQLPPERVKVLPNTVLPAFQPRDRDSIRRELGLDDHEVLLTVCRLAATEAYKGHDRVLRCLPALLISHPRVLYVITSGGDDEARLRQLAAELGLTDRVRFIGHVKLERLPALYSAADLFVMPSTGEGFGIVYLEAMACGTPALGLDVDGSRDPLRDGQLGRVATADSLCESIHQALVAGRPQGLAKETQRWFGMPVFADTVGYFVRTVLQTRRDTA